MGCFLMLLAVLMKWADILQMQLFQINQSEESSKITINAHTTATKIRANVKVSSLARSCLHKISCSVQAAPAS